MKSPLPFFLCLPLAMLTAAHAGTLMVSVVDSGDLDPANNLATATNYNLDALGSTGWKMFTTSTAPSDSKSGGTGISDITVTGATISAANSNWSPVYTWTGGTPTTSGMRVDLDFATTKAGDTTGEFFALSADATTSLQSLYVFAGVSRAGGTLTASLSDGSAMAVTTSEYNVGSGTFGHITYRIDFSADALSGETLDISWTKTSSNGSATSSLRFQGAALTVPEPSAGLLSFAALGLAVFRRRR